MAQPLQDLTHRALRLPASERVELVHRLIAGLNLGHDEDAKWLEEIEKRREDIDTGRVVCQPIGKALRSIREKLRDARSRAVEDAEN